MLKQEMLQKLYEGHVGIEKGKNRARLIFYWPHLNKHIDYFIKKCKICEKFSRKNKKELLLSYPISKFPWQRVDVDIFSCANQLHFVVMDAYSN